MRWIYASLIFLYIKDTESCPAGEFMDLTCQPCPLNTYKDESHKFCQHCEKGYYTNKTGSKSVNDCKLCGTGHYMHIISHRCVPCQVNTFKENATDMHCEACPKGTYTDSSGSSKEDQCKGCPPGEHKYWGTCIENNDGSNRSCKLRDSNTYYNYTNCPDCPPAYHNYSWSDYCQPCPLDTYKEDGQVECVSCPEGSITRSVGTINATLCFPNPSSSSSTSTWITFGVSIGLPIVVLLAFAVWFRRRMLCRKRSADNLKRPNQASRTGNPTVSNEAYCVHPLPVIRNSSRLDSMYAEIDVIPFDNTDTPNISDKVTEKGYCKVEEYDVSSVNVTNLKSNTVHFAQANIYDHTTLGKGMERKQLHEQGYGVGQALVDSRTLPPRTFQISKHNIGIRYPHGSTTDTYNGSNISKLGEDDRTEYHEYYTLEKN